MKTIVWIGFLLIATAAFTQNPPLRVAITNYTPPFVMRAKKQLFGFDVSMMLSLCKLLERECQFQPTKFDELFPLLNNGQADVAVGNISITLERMKLVDFSSPYLPGIARFIGLQKYANIPITPDFLANKSIGVYKGSMLKTTLENMNIKNATIQMYHVDDDIISALVNKDIDVAILQQATALYWQDSMPNVISMLGKPMPYPYGLGLAVNKGNRALLNTLNQALSVYLKSQAFKDNYNMYMVF